MDFLSILIIRGGGSLEMNNYRFLEGGQTGLWIKGKSKAEITDCVFANHPNNNTQLEGARIRVAYSQSLNGGISLFENSIMLLENCDLENCDLENCDLENCDLGHGGIRFFRNHKQYKLIKRLQRDE